MKGTQFPDRNKDISEATDILTRSLDKFHATWATRADEVAEPTKKYHFGKKHATTISNDY